uniref:Uncharacterized protein n=1 Tax=Rhizophora mucronata TaxID=61149 RepID=A0A2P2QSG6_RHIMU
MVLNFAMTPKSGPKILQKVRLSFCSTMSTH